MHILFLVFEGAMSFVVITSLQTDYLGNLNDPTLCVPHALDLL